MSDKATFTIPEGARGAYKALAVLSVGHVSMMVDEFIKAGCTPTEAGSMACHILIHEAWEAASDGRIADGETPKPERFVRACREVALGRSRKRYRWRLTDAGRAALEGGE